MEKIPIQLASDEKIVMEIKPSPRAKFQLILSNPLLLLLLFFFLIFGLPLLLLTIFSIPLLPFIAIFAFRFFILFIMLIAGAFLLFSLFVLLPASLAYKWEYYWITNKRIVVQKGLIGHSIQIVPLERISDIIVSRNWLEKLLGIGSLLVQSLAGQYTPYVPFGAELRLLGLTNPEEVQQLIFDLIKKKREEENLRF